MITIRLVEEGPPFTTNEIHSTNIFTAFTKFGQIDIPSLPAGFSLQEAVSADLDEMTRICLRSMSWDPLTKTLNEAVTPAEAHAVCRAILEGKMTIGLELGACTAYKAVNENGKMVAYGGLGIPKDLTPEQKQVIQGLSALPPDIPESLLKFSAFSEGSFLKYLFKNGYDSTQHFVRQGTGVDPDYQRRGFGRMIVKKCNDVADASEKATFARTRPTNVKLFEEGYRILEEIEMPYEEFGIEGKSKIFVEKREVGGV